MTTCNKTYQVQKYDATEQRVCQRPVLGGGLCYGHLDDPLKSMEAFVEGIKKDDERGAPDFSQFIFPKGKFSFPFRFWRPLLCQGATFHCKLQIGGRIGAHTSFEDAQFFEEVRFVHCDFSPDYFPSVEARSGTPAPPDFGRDIVFINAVFNSLVTFDHVTMRIRPDFRGAQFRGRTFFDQVQATENGGSLRFEETRFLGPTVITVQSSPRTPSIVFVDCDLSGVEMSQLMEYENNLEIVGNNSWKRTFSLGELSKRMKIQDEKTLAIAPGRLIATYKFLENYFFKRSEYSLASQCHIGQLVARRRDKEYERTSKVLNWLYQVLANYSESVSRPFFVLVLIWILFAVAFFNLGLATQEITTESQSIGFFSSLVNSLSLSFLGRRYEIIGTTQKFLLLLETLINLIMASLLILAIRRKFVPRKPIA